MPRPPSNRSAYAHYTISVITLLEIVKGFHKLQREDRVQQFLDELPGVELLTLDQRNAASRGGSMRIWSASGNRSAVPIP